MFKFANEWLTRRLAENRERNQGKISVGPDGIERVRGGVAGVLHWEDVVRVEAKLSDAYLGDNRGLVIQAHDGQILQVLEYDPAWRSICEALEHYLRGSVPYAQWSLRTAFTEESRRFLVYSRGS